MMSLRRSLWRLYFCSQVSCFEFEFARRRSNSINLFSLHCADRPLAAVVLFFGPMDTIEEEETLTDAADAVEEGELHRLSSQVALCND